MSRKWMRAGTPYNRVEVVDSNSVSHCYIYSNAAFWLNYYTLHSDSPEALVKTYPRIR